MARSLIENLATKEEKELIAEKEENGCVRK